MQARGVTSHIHTLDCRLSRVETVRTQNIASWLAVLSVHNAL